jgi:hypothetical protein
MGWRSCEGITLLVGGSRDRSPVTEDFFRGIRQFHVPWGRLSQDIPGGKDGRYVRVTTLPPSRAECLDILEP